MSAVYSPAHFGIVLFGGNDDTVKLDETWLYQGGTWLDLSAAVRPPPRNELAMVADFNHGTVVLYGGRGLSGVGLSDTWILTGSTWTQSPASGPGPRLAHTMAFDSIRDVAIVAGGAVGVDDSELTWEFDGSTWSPVITRYSPDMRREASAMVWDATRQVALLTGGAAWGQRSTYGDTWAYGADDDGDLRVGGYDNCPQVANANQANGDEDARGDVCDCAPSDAGNWASPAEVQALALSGAGLTTIDWGDQSATVGPGVRYDVVTGSLAALRATGSFAGATCLGSQLMTASTSDASTPITGDGFYYLVRAKNVCAVASYGRAALDSASPCP